MGPLNTVAANFYSGDLVMKKMLLALAAIAAFTGSASAADLPRPYAKAPPPPPPPVATWTGCYIGGGGGYGLWNQENRDYTDIGFRGATVRTQITDTMTAGGRGYFGTVQGGCDYQFALGAHQFVVGAFADGDFGNIHGRNADGGHGIVADEKLSQSWAVGGRVGWLVFPQLLTYFSAGYTEARFDRENFTTLFAPFNTPAGVYINQRTYNGWFLGAGDEYAIGFFPGLFWKTEYRVAEYNTKTNPFLFTATGLPTFESQDSHKWVQTIRSELVYRFNWGGPVVAKY
jgi:outer membrane immunogenic protein